MNSSSSSISSSMSDECGASFNAHYDQTFHIISVFIILGCSLCGTLLPIIGKKFPAISKHKLPFACGKLFGTGVILATSLIHMLLPANENLSSPCLPEYITDYPYAGAACLGAILFTQFIQFLVSLKLSHKHNESTPLLNPPGNNTKEKKEHDHGHEHGMGLVLQSPNHVSVYILEVGVLSHSVIIGIALGLAREPEFQPLVIALAFHQFFEGLALSTIVIEAHEADSASSFPSSHDPSQYFHNPNVSFSRLAKTRNMTKAYVIAFVYTFATPIGIAIGIATNSSFNENSDANLLSQGFLDAVSAGILIYDSLVNILGPHFEDTKFKHSSNFSRFTQLICLWLGTAIMALIGKWA